MSDAQTIPVDAHAMIIGAMKCGTTSLYDYLCCHPQICPATMKEPEYFSEHQGHGLDVANYNDLFQFDCLKHRYTLDGSTGYTKFPSEQNVAKRIFDSGIRPKLIYLMRNPFDRIESHFNFKADAKNWSLELLDEHLIMTCDYFLQLEQYRQHFQIDNILLLDFDDLKNKPADVVGRTFDFLGIDRSHSPTVYDVKNQTNYRSNLERTLRKIGAEKLLRFLPRSIKVSLTSIAGRLSKIEKRRLTKDERNVVFKRLEVGMKGLNDTYGFNPEKWGF